MRVATSAHGHFTIVFPHIAHSSVCRSFASNRRAVLEGVKGLMLSVGNDPGFDVMIETAGGLCYM
jgi:hypothetical protein